MPPLLQMQKLPGKGDGGWKKVSLRLFCFFFFFFDCPEDRDFVEREKKKKNVLGHPIARATSYYLLPDTF